MTEAKSNYYLHYHITFKYSKLLEGYEGFFRLLNKSDNDNIYSF